MPTSRHFLCVLAEAQDCRDRSADTRRSLHKSPEYALSFAGRMVSDNQYAPNFEPTLISGLAGPKHNRLVLVFREATERVQPSSSSLYATTAPSDVVRRSVRNLEKVKLIAADQLNVFDLLHANSLVMGEDALATIQEVYGND